MTLRRLVLVVGAAVLVVGIIGLLVPVSVSDGNGGSLGCGNAAVSNLQCSRGQQQVGGQPSERQLLWQVA